MPHSYIVIHPDRYGHAYAHRHGFGHYHTYTYGDADGNAVSHTHAYFDVQPLSHAGLHDNGERARAFADRGGIPGSSESVSDS